MVKHVRRGAMLMAKRAAICVGLLLMASPTWSATLAHWTFDEGSGTVANDASGNGHTGTIIGADWTTGKSGSALYFNAADFGDYVQVPNSPDFNYTAAESFTWEAWINPDTGASYRGIIGRGATQQLNWLYRGSASGNDMSMELQAYTEGYLANTNIEPNSGWHHVAVSLDRSNNEMKFYVNGEMTNSHILTYGDIGSGNPLYIGWYGWSFSDRWFGGAIDEVRISDVALQPAEFIGYPFVEPPKYVVFRTTRDGNQEIYRMDEDGSNLVNLTNHPSNDSTPSASPDGSRIVFTSDRDGSYEIYTMDFYGNDLKQLTDGSISSFIPSYSPDSQKILYSSYVGGTSNAEIFVMDADGGNKQQLTANPARDESAVWSPDGTKILFTRLTGSGWQLFSMDPDGSNENQLTSGGNNRDVAWSPDGMQIAYDNVSGSNISRADIDPAATGLSNIIPITSGSNEGVPSWNPGNRILYQLSDHSIYVMDSDGSNQTLLTTSTGINEYPRWLCAAFAEVSLPDTVASYNQSISVPVSINNVYRDIVSAELFVTFDNALLTFGSVVTTGALAAGWTIESNVAAGVGGIDTLKIAAATDNSAISTDGTLFHVDFQVADVRQPNSSALDIVHALLNDGTPETVAIDGSVTIVGNDASGSTDVATIIPRETITVTIVDADEDLDGAASTDQVTVSVANGEQSETLVLNETATPGEFSGSISTVFALGSTSAANSSDGSVQAKKGDQIVFSFVDQLLSDGSGPANLNLLVNVIGGTDGSVEMTQVTQPGDTIYLKVVDADLNADAGVQETAQVVVTSDRGETETVTLTELDADDEVFFGTLASAPGVNGTDEDGTIHGIKGDTLTVTYDDVVTEWGDQVDRIDLDVVVNPFGDADGNLQVQAFDAAQVLLHVLNPFLTGLELLQADVADPFGSITPYDAALILQYRVGLISVFPVQQAASLNHPQPTPSSPKQIADTRSLRLVAGEGYISVMADQREYIVSGDVLLKGIEGDVLLKGIDGQVQLPEELGDFLVASRATDGGLRVVFAGAEGVEGPGELLRVYGVGPDGASLVRASFNDGSIVAWMDAGPVQNTPATYALHANTPNPFNPETIIAFDLPQDSVVHLDIYDALGQKVRTLVSSSLATGAHRFAWDSRDARGSQVSSGVYFYRLQAGEYVQTRRMLLLK